MRGGGFCAGHVNMRMGKAADAGRGDSHLEGLISGVLGCSSRPFAGLPSLGGGHRGHPPPRGVVSVRSLPRKRRVWEGAARPTQG